MNIDAVMPEASGQAIRTTTARREWWGWTACITWLFFLMYGHELFLLPEFAIDEAGSPESFIFMLVFAISIAAFGWLFGRDPDGLSKIALFTTPVAIAITAILAFLPQSLCSVLYIVSPAFMAPVLARRVYGVIFTAAPGSRLTRYMSGIVVCVAIFTICLMMELPTEIVFLIPALLSICAWAGVCRSVPVSAELPEAGAFLLSKRIIIVLVLTVAVLCWLDALNASIHTNITFNTDEATEFIYSLLGSLLPLAGFLLYAIISDKGYERIGFIGGMALYLIGIQLAYIQGGENSAVLLPLAIADGIGGTYTEFFILTFPLYFLANTKRPVFVASLGVALNLISSAALNQGGNWIPEVFQVLDTPLLVTASITTIVFIALVYILFINQREKTLAAALYALLHSGADGRDAPAALRSETPTADAAPGGPDTEQEIVQAQSLISAGLTQDEIKIAQLMIEGVSKRNIANKLHLTAADFSQHEKDIRQKLNLLREPDPAIAAVAAEYKLTKREKEMLIYLSRGAGNDEIAAEMYLSDETIKSHVRSLMKKLPVEKRQDVPAWLETYEN